MKTVSKAHERRLKAQGKETEPQPFDAIDPAALQAMRERGGRWAAYRNADLSHPECGRLTFLKFGEGCTFTEPPPRHPDTADIGLGWRYRHVGTVDLDAGAVVETVR